MKDFAAIIGSRVLYYLELFLNHYTNTGFELHHKVVFESNKGYGTQEHIEAIQQYGPCEHHRRTFIKNFI